MRTLCAAVLVMAVLSGCSHKKRAGRAPIPAPPRGAARQTPVPPVGYTESGVASWYGHPYHGRQAANGEIYDMEQMVAAHRTLPFDTWVQVHNKSNGKDVEVRIIDRGPFIDGRIIDLSHAAARSIELIGPGTAPVEVRVIRTPPVAAPGTFAVQVGAFRDRNNAERVRARMAELFGSAKLIQRKENPGIWRVLVGSEATPDGAAALAGRIRSEAGERNAFVVRLDS